MRGWENPKLFPPKVLRLIPAEQRRAFGLAGLTTEEALDAARIKSERDLQNVMESYFNLRGVVASRSRMDKKTRTKKGTPDFLLALHGRAIAIEAKLPGEELTEDQAKMKERMTAPPNEWEWVTAYSLDDVKAVLHRYEKGVL
jgi:hypothetical protein